MDWAMNIQCYCPLVLGFLVFLLLVCLLIKDPIQNQKMKNEPPGPKPLPILGNLLLLDMNQPYRTFMKLSKEYGSVFMFYMGLKKVVVLCGYRTVKEALVDNTDEFGERDPLTSVKEDKQDYGVAFANGETWKEMRRFALSSLKDFGMGRKVIEDKIIEESGHLLQRIKAIGENSFGTNEVMNAAVLNIICSMVYGSRLDYNDPELKEMVYRVRRHAELLGTRSVQLYQIFPIIGKWISKARAEHKRLSLTNRNHYMKMISRLAETLDTHVSRGIIDAFLIKQKEVKQKNSQFHTQNLIMTVANLFAGGTETTATTLRWGLLYMAKYPHIQDQVHEEIFRVIGSRQVQADDRRHLPFTNAVVHETQRFANVVPLSIDHRTSCDVTFHGHFIKKGTTVVPVLASVLYDEKEWEKPDSFYPAHFLDKDGMFVKRDAFMPFSAGRRACVGESLARMELFIFFVTLMQHFRFTAPPGVTEEELDLTARVGAVRCPMPHKLCAVSLL